MATKYTTVNSINGYESILALQSLESLRTSYFEMEHLYKSAIREVSTKLEILDDEFKVKHKRNPIHNIQSRIKKPESISQKLERKGLDVSIDSAKENLTDIAGIRVICDYIDDIYKIAKMLIRQDDITLIRVADYIKNPKPNGYRSLHIVVTVPVFFSDRKELVPVEIQIRTIAMDFWASLEHQLRYKAIDEVPDNVITELQRCADTISETDMKMQKIYKTLQGIDNYNQDYSDEDDLNTDDLFNID
jgi:putative GTP pyrophosphokinase